MADEISVVCAFRFLCDKQWSDLNEIAGASTVRYCDTCLKAVFLCAKYEDLAEHVTKGHCVAIRDGGDRTLVGALDLSDLEQQDKWGGGS